MKVAPFSIDEIERFRNIQLSSYLHPYTCGVEDRMDEVHKEKGSILDINEDGLFCPSCGYSQNWFNDCDIKF